MFLLDFWQWLSADLDTQPLTVLCLFVFALWVISAVNFWICEYQLCYAGIRPRQLAGIRGILFAPLLHGNWRHLIGNTPPLLILGGFITFQVNVYLYWVTLASWLVGGLGVWLFGEGKVHIGASGLIWGYGGFLLIYGVLTKSILALLFTGLTLYLEGRSLLRGMQIRLNSGISWQGHQFGFAGGLLAARYQQELQQLTEVLPELLRQQVIPGS
ncbi:MAG: rhomboid family intramembrane serine protease [Cyanobacteria bacterium P01_H01_bin.121]